MKDIELRYVGGHVEVYTGAGAFLFSADTCGRRWKSWRPPDAFPEIPEGTGQELENTNVK